MDAIKSVVLGAFMGAVLVVGYVVVRMLVNGKLYSSSELTESYGVAVLGCFTVSQRTCPKNVIDKWIFKMKNGGEKQLSNEDTLDVVSAYIRTIAEKKQYQNILITGFEVAEVGESLIDKICAQAKKDGYNLVYGANLMVNPETIDRMAESDAVLLVETEKVSRYAEIEKELALCANNGVDVMGAIVIK